MPIESEDDLRVRALAAIKLAWDEGSPVAGYDDLTQADTAARAVRRWRTSARRKIDPSDWDARLRDLTKGLIDAFEADRGLVGPTKEDYAYLAAKIADAIRDGDDHAI